MTVNVISAVQYLCEFNIVEMYSIWLLLRDIRRLFLDFGH